jgi:hypothetical protein
LYRDRGQNGPALVTAATATITITATITTTATTTTATITRIRLIVEPARIDAGQWVIDNVAVKSSTRHDFIVPAGIFLWRFSG